MNPLASSQQFRLGNLFLNGTGEIDYVTAISEQYITGTKGGTPSPSVRGVAIDENWLARLGFEMNKRGQFQLDLNKKPAIKGWRSTFSVKKGERWDANFEKEYTGDLIVNLGNSIIKLKTVHQLQNLIYTITGTELPVSVEIKTT